MATLTPSPKMQFFDANGNPLVGGKLYTYSAGTTTPLATYTDSGAGTPNANPVILDSRGEASVWLGTSLYYMELKTSADVLVWTADNIGGVATLSALAASGGSALIGFLQSGSGAVSRTAQSKMRDIVNVRDFGAIGDGVIDDSAAINLALAASISLKKELHFEKKTYLVNSAVLAATLSAGDTLVIFGNGAVINSGMPDSASSYDGFFTINGASANSVTIRDMKVTSTLSGTQSLTRAVGKQVGLAIKTIATLHLENVYVSGFPFIDIWTYKVDGGSIINCSAINASYAGLLAQSCLDMSIIGGSFSGNGGLNGATVEGYGLTCATKFTGADRDNARITVSNIHALDNIGKGIDAHDCLTFTVSNNIVKGFTFCGIYAVNEGGSKNVSDVVISNNQIDGTSSFSVASACYGVQAGGFGTACTYSGNFVINGNTIKTISASSGTNGGILIENGAAGGIAPVSVCISANTLNDAAKGASSFAIKTNSTALAISSVIVSDNVINQTLAIVSGILIGTSTNAVVRGNIINTSSTCTEGLYPFTSGNTVFEGNILTGTFTTPITVFGVAYQIGRANIVNGTPDKDYMFFGRTIEYGTVPPAAGFHYQGSECFNQLATVGQPKSWLCTVQGTPGTWVSTGNL